MTISIYRFDAAFFAVFFGFSSLGGAGVLSIFVTASSNVVGGRMIGLPCLPYGLGGLPSFMALDLVTVKALPPHWSPRAIIELSGRSSYSNSHS